MMGLKLILASAILMILIVQAESDADSDETKTQESNNSIRNSTSSGSQDTKPIDKNANSTVKPSKKPIKISEATKEKYKKWKVKKHNVISRIIKMNFFFIK